MYAYLPFLAFPSVGALIASRRPENPIGWICLAIGVFWMFAIMSDAYALYGLRVASPGSVPFPAAIGSLGVSLAPASAGLIETYASARPRPARIMVSRPPKEWPMMTGCRSRRRMIASS